MRGEHPWSATAAESCQGKVATYRLPPQCCRADRFRPALSGRAHALTTSNPPRGRPWFHKEIVGHWSRASRTPHRIRPADPGKEAVMLRGVGPLDEEKALREYVAIR